jgi:3,8-divinyl chlorophyllide a/chlorophyllide a reductase subunit Y
VQKAKELGIPALYFTNLISARPLMGVPGPAQLAQVVNAAIANKARMDAMKAFFEGVGRATPPASGRARRTSSPSSAPAREEAREAGPRRQAEEMI